jgi:hypothetical protein
VGLTSDDLTGYTDGSLGYYSWLFLRMAGGTGFADKVRVLRFEDFKTTLPALLESFGVAVTQTMRQHLLEAPALNASPQHARELPLAEPLRALLLEKEAWVHSARRLATGQPATVVP